MTGVPERFASRSQSAQSMALRAAPGFAGGEPSKVSGESFAFGGADELLQLRTGDGRKPGNGQCFENGGQLHFFGSFLMRVKL